MSKTWYPHRWIVLGLAFASLGAGRPDLSLVDAVKRGELPAVKAQLDRQVDVNTAESDGATALHWAVHRDDLTTAKLLIAAGASVQVQNDYGVTPLWLACINGNAAMIEALITAGADPNTTMTEGDTALMNAARSGEVDAVKILLAHGADPNAKERHGQTSLMWAAAENNADVVSTLIGAGADINARTTGVREFTPLLFAVRAGRLETARALVDAGADVNEHLTGPKGMSMSALVLATMGAHYDVAALLLDYGANPNAAAGGWGALHEVTWVRRPNEGNTNPGNVVRGNVDSLTFVKKLLAAGADVNARITTEPPDGTHGSTQLALVSEGATAFFLASFRVDVPFMRLLLEHGADPHIPNAVGTTPLMAAAGVGYVSDAEPPFTPTEALEAFNICLALDGDVTRVDERGDTALHGAAFRGVNEIVQTLVDRGARLDVKMGMRERGRGVVDYGRGGNWTPWRIAEGVFWGNGHNRRPETAALLRKLMEERGIPVE